MGRVVFMIMEYGRGRECEKTSRFDTGKVACTA
jgi:hypothetical protein